MVRLDPRAVEEFPFPPFKPALLPGRAQSVEASASDLLRRLGSYQPGVGCLRRGRRGRARSDERGEFAVCAMAIGATDLDGSARLAVKFAVPMAVLLEMAVHAVHPFLQGGIVQVHGHTLRRVVKVWGVPLGGLLELVGIR